MFGKPTWGTPVVGSHAVNKVSFNAGVCAGDYLEIGNTVYVFTAEDTPYVAPTCQVPSVDTIPISLATGTMSQAEAMYYFSGVPTPNTELLGLAEGNLATPLVLDEQLGSVTSVIVGDILLTVIDDYTVDNVANTVTILPDTCPSGLPITIEYEDDQSDSHTQAGTTDDGNFIPWITLGQDQVLPLAEVPIAESIIVTVGQITLEPEEYDLLLDPPVLIVFATSNRVPGEDIVIDYDYLEPTNVIAEDTITIGDYIFEFDVVGTGEVGEGNIPVDVSGNQTPVAASVALINMINNTEDLPFDAVSDEPGEIKITTLADGIYNGSAGNLVSLSTTYVGGFWDSNTLTGGAEATGEEAAQRLIGFLAANQDILGLIDAQALSTVEIIARVPGTAGNDIVCSSSNPNIVWDTSTTLLGVNGTPGRKTQIMINTTHLFICITDSPIGLGWRRIALTPLIDIN